MTPNGMRRRRARGMGEEARIAEEARPTMAPFYARSRRVPSEAPPAPIDAGGEMTRERAKGTAVSRQYGLEYLRRKKIIRPFKYTINGTNPWSVAASSTVTAPITINKEADFELHKISAVVDIPTLGIVGGRGDDFTFRIRDERKQQYMDNGPIHCLCGTGSGIFPLVLPDTKWFSRSANISIEITNRRALAIDVWLDLHGRNFYGREFENLTDIPDFERLSKQAKQFFIAKQTRYIEPYMFTLDTSPLSLAAGATADAEPISIRQEGAYEIFAYACFSSQPFSFRLQESNNGRFVSSGHIASGAGIGDGERPHLLPEPYFLDSNSQLFVSFTDLGNAGTNTIFFVLIGRKWFDVASMNLTAGPDFFMDRYDSVM